MTTVSSGGFSPHPLSIGGYQNPTAEWITTFFMLVAGVSLPLLWVGVFRSPGKLLRDGELRTYLGGFALLGLGIALIRTGGLPSGEVLRSSLFSAASVISATGFGTVDWNQRPGGALALLLMLMILCACAGSTGGCCSTGASPRARGATAPCSRSGPGGRRRSRAGPPQATRRKGG